MQAITSSMLTSSSSRVSTFCLYTSLFIKPHKQNSNGVKSGDLGGQLMVLPRPIQLLGNIDLSSWNTLCKGDRKQGEKLNTFYHQHHRRHRNRHSHPHRHQLHKRHKHHRNKHHHRQTSKGRTSFREIKLHFSVCRKTVGLSP